MTDRALRRSLFCVLVVLGLSRPAAAQAPFESVGTRAEGMAGAFVAVADDASAVYWNPAGIASGSLVSAVISFGQISQPAESPANSTQPFENQRDSGGIVALSATAIGGAYYRLST